MVDSFSDATVNRIGKTNWWKKSRNKEVYSVQCNNPVNIRCLQDTPWIHFHHPYIWQHFDVAQLSWPQHLLKYVGHHILCIARIICPPTHARKIIMNSIWPVANHWYWG